MTRLYELTDDPGVRDFLSFLIARDTMHQNQWLAAIEELEKDGLESTPCPSSFPQELEKTEVSYQFWNQSAGLDSQRGRWASGKSLDGRGESSTWRSRSRSSASRRSRPGPRSCTVPVSSRWRRSRACLRRTAPGAG